MTTAFGLLADELLFGRLVGGGKVAVDLDGEGKVMLSFAEAPPSPPAPAEGETDIEVLPA